VWAVRELYVHAGEKIPEDVENRLKIVGTLREEQRRHLLTDARLALGRRANLNTDKDLSVILNRMLWHHDPRSFCTPAPGVICCQFIPYFGIGAHLGKDARTGQLHIVTPIRGGPAHQAGLYAGDAILAITRTMNDAEEPLNVPETIGTA